MSKQIKPLGNQQYQPKIINQKNLNAYGVLLHTRKSIEEFQINSGMKGAYTKEYQHHYWAANARLAVDGQVLDISIPLILFNYDQTVTGGDIKFDLIEVEKVSNSLQEAAIAKFKELQETKIYKYITEEIGIEDWQIVPLNTQHCHPGGQNQSFSGIDLRTDAKYPGVVYPLSKGKMIPSFSAIMAHIDGICRTVHSEYRLFNEAENGDKIYAHGRCATIIRGFTPKPFPRVKQPEPVAQKMIDKIFNISPKQPKAKEQKEAVLRPHIFLKNLMGKEDGEEFLKELETVWLATEFDPDTTAIDKENIKTHTIVRQNYYGQGNLWQGDRQKNAEGNGKKDKTVSLFDQKAAIVKWEIATWAELQGQTNKDIEDLYAMVELAELHLEQEDEDEFNRNDAIDFLEKQGYQEVHLFQCTDEKLKHLVMREEHKDEKTELPSFTIMHDGVKYSIEEIEKIRVLLEEENYLSFAKINQMSEYNIVSYFSQFYTKPGER